MPHCTKKHDTKTEELIEQNKKLKRLLNKDIKVIGLAERGFVQTRHKELVRIESFDGSDALSDTLKELQKARKNVK